MDVHYRAVYEPQEPSGFFVRFIDLAEAVTQGEDLDACAFNGAEVLSLVLEEYVESSRDIPAPTQGLSDAHYLAPDAKMQAALLVRLARGERSLAELARAGHIVAGRETAGGSAALAEPEAARQGGGARQEAGARVRVGKPRDQSTSAPAAYW